MFGRTVSIDGTEIFIFCTPTTPYSEILRRASMRLSAEEEEARRSHPDIVAYNEAVRLLNREIVS